MPGYFPLSHNKANRVVLNPQTHFHQWLLHALGRGELPLLLKKECELSIRKEKYFSRFARKYLGYVS